MTLTSRVTQILFKATIFELLCLSSYSYKIWFLLNAWKLIHFVKNNKNFFFVKKTFLKNVPSAIRDRFPVAARLQLIEIVLKPTEKTKSERVTTPGYKTIAWEAVQNPGSIDFETVYFSLSKW